MAYASMEGAIMLKGTRHGLLVSVREDADWREVLRELTSVAQHNPGFLKDAQLVLDFGWRELSEEQFEAIVATMAELGLGCNGILSTSLHTRTIAEARGYRAIIGRLGLAQHQGRRWRREPEVLESVAPVPRVCSSAATSSRPPTVEVEPELTPPTIASGLVIAPVPPQPKGEETPSAAPETVSPSSLDEPLSPPKEGVEDSLEALPVIAEDSVEKVEISTFDSTDPVIASLPAVYDSSESSRSFSSSEPGIHVPHFQDEEPTLYLRKTLRSGQRVVFAGNVVLLGDLNPGAQIEADGDVIVLGQLRGSVHAGCEGDTQATVITSSLRATQLRIADRFYKPDSSHRFFKKTPLTGTLRARLDGETVIVEALAVR